MNKVAVVVVGGLLVVLFIWGFRADLPEDTLYDSPAPPTLYVDGPIEIGHSYVDGVHLFQGEITLPTPCHELSSEALILESYPEQIILRLTATQTAEACIQVLSTKKFEIEVTASEQATFRFYLNGEEQEIIVNELEM